MNRLPPPIWNLPPIANQNGGNFVSHDVRYGCGPYHPAYAQYRPQYQTFAPRAPFYPGIMGSNAQDGKPPRSDSSQSTEPTTAVKFSCDVCERFFNTKQILESHLQSHVECDHEGCSFTASRKMVKLHFIQNHAKGRLRIKLDTPEDIEKWREQRRKKYPTPANVEKKLAEEKARCENGQVAQTQNYRYRGNKQRNKSHCNRQQHSKHQRQFPPPNQADNQNACKMKTKKMDPLSMILGDTRSTSEESADTSSLVQPSVTTNTSALQALSASYGGGSSSDESDAADQEMNNNDKVVTSAEKIASAQSLSVKTKTQQIPSPARNNRKRRQEFTKNMTQQCKSKITLLEKLLAPQIRHENNTILQCVRYIVKKNYLGVMQEQNKLC